MRYGIGKINLEQSQRKKLKYKEVGKVAMCSFGVMQG